MRRLLLPVYLVLSACVPTLPTDTASRAAVVESALPAMKVFATPRIPATTAANADIARDFIDLGFALESGRALPVFTRFEGPISVRVTGAPPRSLGPDLARLLQRMRTEAGIDIARTQQKSANITIEAVTRAEIRRYLPTAACFVVPNVSSLAEYRRARRSQRLDWTRLRARETLAIFLPADASPQEVRDCLHEELAQAIGPLNDLYRLPESVFNDDNVHTVLTAYDMLILRAYYDPALRNGMTRAQVAQRLPGILARINPAGAGRVPQMLPRTPRAWSDAVQTALGPGIAPPARMRAAQQALRIAQAEGWTDHRRGFAHFVLGRLMQASDANAAQAQFAQADAVFATHPQTRLHRAFVASQRAGYAISQNRAEAALALLDPHLDTAAAFENAGLLATLLLLRAEALEMTGRVDQARSVRLDSIGWARYGFGPEWAVRAKLREVSTLNPLKGSLNRL